MRIYQGFMSIAIFGGMSRDLIRCQLHHSLCWFVLPHLTTTIFALCSSTPSKVHATTPPGAPPLSWAWSTMPPASIGTWITATSAPPLSRGMWVAWRCLTEELGQDEHEEGPKQWEAYLVCHESKPRLWSWFVFVIFLFLPCLTTCSTLMFCPTLMYQIRHNYPTPTMVMQMRPAWGNKDPTTHEE